MEEIALDSASFGAVWNRVTSGGYDSGNSYADTLSAMISGAAQLLSAYSGAARRFSRLAKPFYSLAADERALLSKLQREYFILTGDTRPVKLSAGPGCPLLVLLRDCLIGERQLALFCSTGAGVSEKDRWALFSSLSSICETHDKLLVREIERLML